MIKLALIVLILVFFVGCTELNSDMILIDDANYSSDLNVEDANFTTLNDTPNSYIGAALKCVRVNAGENALEFSICTTGGGGGTSYIGIGDVNVDNNQNQISLNDTFYISLDENYARITDVNGADILRAKISDVNGADLLRALISDVNGADNLRAKISDVNGADALRILISDSNNTARLYYKVIADWNDAVKFAVDWNALGITDDVNSWIDAKISLMDVNAGLGRFAGYSISSYDGNIFFGSGATRTYGYRASHMICDSNYSGSHVCSGIELLLTIADGNISGFTGTAWIMNASISYTSNSNDCVGFTQNSGTGYYGTFWDFTSGTTRGGDVWLTGCNNFKKLACCK